MEKITIDEVPEFETNPAESLRCPLGAPPGTEDVDSDGSCRPCDAEASHTFDVEGTRVIHTCREFGNELRYGL